MLLILLITLSEWIEGYILVLLFPINKIGGGELGPKKGIRISEGGDIGLFITLVPKLL